MTESQIAEGGYVTFQYKRFLVVRKLRGGKLELLISRRGNKNVTRVVDEDDVTTISVLNALRDIPMVGSCKYGLRLN